MSDSVLTVPCFTQPTIDNYCDSLEYYLVSGFDGNRAQRIALLEEMADNAGTQEEAELLRKLQIAEIDLELGMIIDTSDVAAGYSKLKQFLAADISVPYERLTSFAAAAGELSEAYNYFGYIPEGTEAYEFFKDYLMIVGQGETYHKLTPQEQLNLDIIIQEGLCPPLTIPADPIVPTGNRPANELHLMESLESEYEPIEGDFEGLSKISIFPNPAQDQFELYLPELSQGQGYDYVRIVDWSGKVHRNYRSLGSGRHTISTSGLTSGSYFVFVLSNGNLCHRKLIVNH